MSLPSLPLTAGALAASYRARGYWRDVTLAQRFFDVAARHPDKTALICGERSITYGELAHQVRTLAAHWVALGLAAGDVVAGQLPNSLEMPLLHLACNTVGLLYMPLHDSWREGELAHLLNLAQVKVVVTMGAYRGFDHAGMFRQMQAETPSVAQIFSVDGASEGVLDWATLLVERADAAALIRDRAPDPDSPAALMLSGGTTALSKVSRFSSNNLLAMLEPAAVAARFSANDVAAALAPAGTGATGYIYPILMPLLWGATSVILPRWGDPAQALALLQQHRCSYAVAIPAQMTKLVPALEQLGAACPPTLRCFTNAGAPLSLATAQKVEHFLACRVQSIYGSTDGGVPTMTDLDDPDDKRLRTVGRVVPYADLSILDEAGHLLGPGLSGEVIWRGADKSWGYLGADDQTAQTFTAEGYYKSGDLGYLDEGGYLHITGRIKDMILRGGRNISPQSIEVPLLQHPAVLDVAVAPAPDPVLGERACAFVILRPAHSLSFEDMVAFLKEQKLAVWQLPEQLVLLDEFPRGAGGKVQKAKLTALVTPPDAKAGSQ